jgi:hypothetical protein
MHQNRRAIAWHACGAHATSSDIGSVSSQKLPKKLAFGPRQFIERYLSGIGDWHAQRIGWLLCHARRDEIALE